MNRRTLAAKIRQVIPTANTRPNRCGGVSFRTLHPHDQADRLRAIFPMETIEVHGAEVRIGLD